MVLLRYILYFISIALVTWLLTGVEIAGPGGLNLHVFAYPEDTLGTSEFSPVEAIQAVILVTCALLYAWIAKYCPSQRPIALVFGGLAVIFFIRELDYFLDRFIADNFWQALMAIVAALVIVYTNRQWRRFRIAWMRIWPSPGITLLFAGAVVVFAFVSLVGREELWMAILGNGYQRVAKLAVEELVELLGYFLWLVGTVEYAYQAQVIMLHDPQTVVAKRRAGRHPKSKGRY